MRPPLALMVACAIAAGGCTISLHRYDLKASVAGFVDSSNIHKIAAEFRNVPRFWASTANDQGQVLHVRLSTSKDLWRLANKVGSVNAEWSFCDAPSREVHIGYPVVYAHGEKVSAIHRKRPSPLVANSEGRFAYDAILYVRYSPPTKDTIASRRDGNVSERSDFERDPRDVCVLARTTDMVRVFKTNVAKIPKEEIAAAFVAAAQSAPAGQGRGDDRVEPPTVAAYRPEESLRRHFPIVVDEEGVLVGRDCAHCPRMTVVPSGLFRMGSDSYEEGRSRDEGPEVVVTIPERFAIGSYEVTVGEFGRFSRETGRAPGDSCMVEDGGRWAERKGLHWKRPGFEQTDAHPAVCASWEDARAYAEWLSQKTGEDYRLPSESAWEYAARAYTRSSRHWGGAVTGQCRSANGADESARRRLGTETVAPCDDGHPHTAPAGSFAPNRWGLRDALGNAWEWTLDCWNESHEGAPIDGSPRLSGDCAKRVLRGGSWRNAPWALRSANRYWLSADARTVDSGFRVVRRLRTDRQAQPPQPDKLPPVGEPFRDALRSSGRGPLMVRLPSASFWMGDEELSYRWQPRRQVTIDRAAALGVYEVTFAEWDACVAGGGCEAVDDEGWGRGLRPVINVGWKDAQAYARWLSAETGHAYRLPSEAEWEFAARAGTETAYGWGDRLGRNRANCDRCGSPWDGEQTAPVGEFTANGWGLHDMHGNVWEWVEDCWPPGPVSSGYRGAPADGSAWLWGDCGLRVLRGGSWFSQRLYLHSAARSRDKIDTRGSDVGFRVARTLAP